MMIVVALAVLFTVLFGLVVATVSGARLGRITGDSF